MRAAQASVLILALAALSARAQTDNQLSQAEKCQGFKMLFDGSTIDSFKANWVNYIKDNATNTNLDAGWKVDATTKAVITSGPLPDIRSKIMYKDFDFRLDFRNSGNQGIYYRTLLTTGAAYETGVEFAIEDNPSVAPVVIPGSAYDMFGAVPGHYNTFASGKWNVVRIVVKGDSVEHWMNGFKVVGFRYHTPAWWTAYDTYKWKGFSTFCMKVPGNRNGGYIDNGYLGFQGDHDGKWFIKNLKVNATETAAFGPASTAETGPGCPVNDFQAQERPATGFTLEHTGGLTRLRFSGLSVTKVSLIGLDGRNKADVRLEDQGGAAIIAGPEKPGVYFLQAVAADQKVISGKILLP
jgi:hypothetical protein